MSAGEDVLVTRRGKPVMRLTAADPATVPRSGNQALPAPEIADGPRMTSGITPSAGHPPVFPLRPAVLLRGLERRRRIEATALTRQLERAVGELGRFGATERLVAEGEREQDLTQQLGALEIRRRPGGR